MNNVTQKIRLWCMNDEGLYTAIVDFVQENSAKAKNALIEVTSDFIRELLVSGVRERNELPATIYMDLLNDVNFGEISAEFIDDVLWWK